MLTLYRAAFFFIVSSKVLLSIGEYDHASRCPHVRKMETKGDLYVIGVFPVTNQEGFHNDSLLWATALKYTIDVLNTQILNVKVGYVIYDNCGSTNRTIKLLADTIRKTECNSYTTMLPSCNSSRNTSSTILGVVGLMTLNEAREVSKYLLKFKIPLFYYNGKPTYTTKSAAKSTYYDIEIIDERDANIIKETLVDNGKNFAALITTRDVYGVYARKVLWDVLKTNSCLVAKSFNLTDEMSFQQIMNLLKNDKDFEVLVLWMEVSSSISFLNTLKNLTVPTKVWISNSDLGNITLASMVNSTRLKRANKTIRTLTVKDFVKYFEEQGYNITSNNNIWMTSYFETYNLTNFTGTFSDIRGSFQMYQARYAVAGARANIAALNSLHFVNKSNIERIKEYNVNTFKNINPVKPLNHGLCRINCSSGYKIYYEKKTAPHAGGWDYRYAPSCMDLRDYISYDSVISIIVYVLICMGIIEVIFVIVLFTRNRETPFVRISYKKTFIAQLVLHALLFLVLILFFVKEENTIRITRSILIGILLTSVLAITLTQAYQLHVSSTASRVATAKDYVTERNEYVFIFLIICVQATISTLSLAFYPSRVGRFGRDEELLIHTTFGFMLMFICLLQAYKARDFSEGFNEAKFIILAMTLSIVVVVIFLPLRFTFTTNKAKSYADVITLVVINYIQLLLMYSRKCWIIVFHSDEKSRDFYNNVKNKISVFSLRKQVVQMQTYNT